MTKEEREIARDMGHLHRTWGQDLTEACRLLFKAGADEEEVDVILGKLFVPSQVDEDWALRSRSWYIQNGGN